MNELSKDGGFAPKKWILVDTIDANKHYGVYEGPETAEEVFNMALGHLERPPVPEDVYHVYECGGALCTGQSWVFHGFPK